MIEEPRVALCADEEALRYPEALGLGGERLEAQQWLSLFSGGEEARARLRAMRSVEEVWVASSSDVDAINLAATLKQDCPERYVCLLSFQGSGSLRSRANAGRIDAMLTKQEFARRYALRKERQSPGSGGFGGEAPACGFSVRPEPGGRAPLPREQIMPLDWRRGEGEEPLPPRRVPPPLMREGERDARSEGAMARELPESSREREGMRAPVSTAHDAFVLPIVGGSGGVGKSTIAVLAAHFAQGLGYQTLLLDLDLQFGDAAGMAGAREALAVDEVLANPTKVDRLRTERLLPAVLAAPQRMEDSERLAEQAGKLLDLLRDRFDVIVVNTGSAWSEGHAAVLERSAKALFLVDQRASSLHAAKHALELCGRCGIATKPFLFAVNRCAKNAPLSSLDASCSLGGAPAVELQDGGREVEELLLAGQPLDLINSKNALCVSLERVLVDVLPGGGERVPSEGAEQGREGLSALFGLGRKNRKRR